MSDFDTETQLPKIIVVDDDVQLGMLIERRLQKVGYDTLCVTTGEDAIRQAKRHSPVLLVLDYVLPDIKGQDVITRLVDDHVQVSFIVTTGHGDETIAVEMIINPIKTEKTTSTIRRCGRLSAFTRVESLYEGASGLGDSTLGAVSSIGLARLF